MQIGDHERSAGFQRCGVDLAGDLLGLGVIRAGAQHNAVRLNRVLHRVALAQKLRVPRDLHLGALLCELVGALLQRSCRAHRHRGLAKNHVAARELRHEILDHRLHVARICRIRAALLRSTHADEVDVGELGRAGVIGGEVKAPGGDVTFKDLRQARLIKRDLARLELLDFSLVHVHAQHLVAQLRHAGGMRCPEVAGPDHRHSHGRYSSRGSSSTRGMEWGRAAPGTSSPTSPSHTASAPARTCGTARAGPPSCPATT